MRMMIFAGLLAGMQLVAASAQAGDAQAEILAADRAFSQRAQEIGPGKAFQEFAAPDVRAFPGGGTALKGKDAITQWTNGWPPSLKIVWEPEEAVAAAGGDLGYSWGYAEFRSQGEDGTEQISYGKYLTVWRKDPEGWRWIADMGNGAPPPGER